MRPELIVARKELRDYLTSKRFIAILTIMFLFSVYGITEGMESYKMELDYYKVTKSAMMNNPDMQQAIEAAQAYIKDAEASGATQEEIDYIRASLEQYVNPQMPGISLIFYKFNDYFVYVGATLAIFLGFNLVSREKEEESLKLLLTRPIFRDAVINGKSIGAISIIILIIALTFLITIAIMLIYKIVPTSEDLLPLALSFMNMSLYCMVFFSISVFVSTLLKNSTDSLIVIIAVVFFLFIVMTFSLMVTDSLAGPSPLLGQDSATSSINEAANNTTSRVPNTVSGIRNQEIVDYINKRHLISEGLNIISPIYNYNIVSNALINNQKPYVITKYVSKPSIFDYISLTWTNILSMLVEIVVMFALSYILFMRMDI